MTKAIEQAWKVEEVAQTLKVLFPFSETKQAILPFSLSTGKMSGSKHPQCLSVASKHSIVLDRHRYTQ